MYYYGGGTNPCSNIQTPYYPMNYQNNNSIYPIILVLFILLVIVLGNRWTN